MKIKVSTVNNRSPVLSVRRGPKKPVNKGKSRLWRQSPIRSLSVRIRSHKGACPRGKRLKGNFFVMIVVVQKFFVVFRVSLMARPRQRRAFSWPNKLKGVFSVNLRNLRIKKDMDSRFHGNDTMWYVVSGPRSGRGQVFPFHSSQ